MAVSASAAPGTIDDLFGREPVPSCVKTCLKSKATGIVYEISMQRTVYFDGDYPDMHLKIEYEGNSGRIHPQNEAFLKGWKEKNIPYEDVALAGIIEYELKGVMDDLMHIIPKQFTSVKWPEKRRGAIENGVKMSSFFRFYQPTISLNLRFFAKDDSPTRFMASFNVIEALRTTTELSLPVKPREEERSNDSFVRDYIVSLKNGPLYLTAW